MAIKNFNIACQTACLPETCFEVSCRPQSQGGNSAIYLIPNCEIESIEDVGDDNLITAITLKGTANGWITTATVLDSITVEESLNISTGAYSYSINMQLAALADGATTEESAKEARNFIDSISNPYIGFMALIQANHGAWYLYGENNVRGLRIADGTNYTSAATSDELAGFNIVLSGNGTIARNVSETVISGLQLFDCNPV